MQQYSNTFMTNLGRPVRPEDGAQIEVYTYPGNVLAVLYSDNGVTPKANPVTTDANGLFEFYAADGRYTLVLTSDVTSEVTLTDGVLLEDPADNGATQITFTQTGTGAVPRTVDLELKDIVKPQQFGAVGDGVADDAPELLLALSTGRLVDGNNRTYGIAGNLVLPVNFKGLINCTLKQLTPTGSNRRTIYASGCSGFVIENVAIDRNGNESGGSIQDDAGIYLNACDNFEMRNVEVFGGGAGNGITYQTCSDFTEFRSKVHDIQYVTGTVPADDVINAIWYNNCHDFTVDSSWVYDCGAKVLGVETKKRSRGFAISGCYNFELYSTTADRVDQGHDITGGVGNHDFSLFGCNANDCNTYSFKAANSAYRGRFFGCIGNGARINFVVSGQTEVSNPRPRDIIYEKCISVDAGKNPGYAGVPAQAFRIQEVSAVDSTYPRGVVYDGCIAIDNQSVPTMDIGFVTDVIPSTAPADINRVRNNCSSTGHITSATSGFNQDNNITGLMRIDGNDPRLLMYESDGPADEKGWDFSLSGGSMLMRTMTDAGVLGASFGRVDRTGTTVDLIGFDGTAIRRGLSQPTRYEESDTQGRITQRNDDNSLKNVITRQNFGISASGQGLSFTYQFGTGGTSGGTAFREEWRATADWSVAGNRSTEYRQYTVFAGTEFESLRVNPRYVGYGSKPMRYMQAQSAVASSVTGTLTKTTLATIAIAAGAIGPNGSIHITALFSMTNNANNKTFTVELAGTAFYNTTLNSQSAIQVISIIRNRNSESSQVGGLVGSTSGIGAAGLVTSAINTASAQNITITAQLANAGDTATLEGYTVEIVYGA